MIRGRLRFGRASLLAALTSISCGLEPSQRYEIERWEAEAVRRGHPEVRYVEYLDPDLALGLGFVPFGAGGFYVRRPGLAISGFLWPISILWAPALAYSSAATFNYREFREKVMALREEGEELGHDADR